MSEEDTMTDEIDLTTKIPLPEPSWPTHVTPTTSEVALRSSYEMLRLERNRLLEYAKELQRESIAARRNYRALVDNVIDKVWNYEDRGCDDGAREFLRDCGILDEELRAAGVLPPEPPIDNVELTIQLNVAWGEVRTWVDDCEYTIDEQSDWLMALATIVEETIDQRTSHGAYPTKSRLIQGAASYGNRDHSTMYKED